MSESVSVTIGGSEYGGWKSATITRSIESISGSFSLSVSDQWSDAGSWPIREGDECSISVDGQTIITGSVDDRSVSFDSESHEVSISGRDKSAVMVDSSVDLGKWEFSNLPTLVFLNKISGQFGIKITLGLGATLPTIPEKKISINPGDKAFDVIDRVAKFAGMLPVSDGVGGVKLVSPGLLQAPGSLIEGENILSGDVTFSQKDRFARYVVLGQGQSGSQIKGEATDSGVKDSGRVLVIQAESATTIAKANERASWEARTRAARAEPVSIKVQGWYCSPGHLWTPGELTTVLSPLLGVGGQMLISTVEMEKGNDGTFTTLKLLRPDAFAASPQSERTWKK